VQKYRAGATLDLVHDRADRGRRLTMPLLVLWGRRSSQGSGYDILGVWRDHAETVTGQAIDSGRFLPEEAPDETYRQCANFFAKGSRSDPIQLRLDRSPSIAALQAQPFDRTG